MKKLLVPRFMDVNNNNAQKLNAKELLKRFEFNNFNVESIYYNKPVGGFNTQKVVLSRLFKGHAWKPSLALFYQKNASAIFYPGLMLRWRCDEGIVPPVIQGQGESNQRLNIAPRTAGRNDYFHVTSKPKADYGYWL